ncbi:hypothetical protein BC830DRAFT_1157291 [Chytriomyces sp. MP71]|nr:hypothetical protein BC830DRAFT_1157291 [Chytriomyces sp. MP71]
MADLLQSTANSVANTVNSIAQDIQRMMAPSPVISLPLGWIAQWSPEYQRYFFIHVETGLTQWEPPLDARQVPLHALPAGTPVLAYPQPSLGSTVGGVVRTVGSTIDSISRSIVNSLSQPNASAPATLTTVYYSQPPSLLPRGFVACYSEQYRAFYYVGPNGASSWAPPAVNEAMLRQQMQAQEEPLPVYVPSEAESSVHESATVHASTSEAPVRASDYIELAEQKKQ